MVGWLALLSIFQSVTPRTAVDAQLHMLGGIDLRVDCHVAFAEVWDGQRTNDGLTADYVFLFMRQPVRAGEGNAVLYIVTLSDGRSWIETAGIVSRSGDAWPDFSATVSMGWGWSRFTSDPAQPGRILYRAEEPHDHDSGYGLSEGSCRLVPQAVGGRPQ